MSGSRTRDRGPGRSGTTRRLIDAVHGSLCDRAHVRWGAGVSLYSGTALCGTAVISRCPTPRARPGCCLLYTS